MQFTLLHDLLNKEWFIGFLSGVAATILGFGLTIIWDKWKIRNESRGRDKTIMAAIHEELVANAKSVEQNISWLNHEIEILSEDKTITQPLVPLKTGFWYLAIVNLPKELLIGDKLALLRNVGFIVDYTNEAVRSRENYRIHNEPMSNYKERLRTIDECLIKSLQALAYGIAEFEITIQTKRMVHNLSTMANGVKKQLYEIVNRIRS